MAAERITPIKKAMVTSGQEIPLEIGSIITGNKEEKYTHSYAAYDCFAADFVLLLFRNIYLPVLSSLWL